MRCSSPRFKRRVIDDRWKYLFILRFIFPTHLHIQEHTFSLYRQSL